MGIAGGRYRTIVGEKPMFLGSKASIEPGKQGGRKNMAWTNQADTAVVPGRSSTSMHLPRRVFVQLGYLFGFFSRLFLVSIVYLYMLLQVQSKGTKSTQPQPNPPKSTLFLSEGFAGVCRLPDRASLADSSV